MPNLLENLVLYSLLRIFLWTTILSPNCYQHLTPSPNSWFSQTVHSYPFSWKLYALNSYTAEWGALDIFCYSISFSAFSPSKLRVFNLYCRLVWRDGDILFLNKPCILNFLYESFLHSLKYPLVLDQWPFENVSFLPLVELICLARCYHPMTQTNKIVVTLIFMPELIYFRLNFEHVFLYFGSLNLQWHWFLFILQFCQTCSFVLNSSP